MKRIVFSLLVVSFVFMCVGGNASFFAAQGEPLSYDEFVAAEVDAPVTIETYVQAKQALWEGNTNLGCDTASIYTQDEDGGYFLYDIPVSADVYEQLEEGTKIRVSGYKSEWAGEVEVVADDDLTEIEIIDGDEYVADPVDVTDMLGNEEAISEFMNQKVSFTDMIVEMIEGGDSDETETEKATAFLYGWDGSGSEGDDLYFNASKDGKWYTFVVESYLCGPDSDVYQAVKKLKAGDTIDMEGFLYWYEGMQPHITSIKVKENKDVSVSSSAHTSSEADNTTDESGAAFTGEIPENTIIPGKVFEFGEKGSYSVSTFGDYEEAVAGKNTYGYFSINGNIVEEEDKDGVPAFGIDGGQVSIYYSYTNHMQTGGKTDWHIVSDKGKTIDTVKLQKEIKKGTIVLQTSVDGEKWVPIVKLTNAFAGSPVQWKPFYMTKGIQLENGCYYRAIVAYKEGRLDGQDGFLFVKTDKNVYRKYAELYEFYLYDINSKKDENLRYVLVDTVTNRTGTDNGYQGSKAIGEKDPHSSFEDMGHFIVSGYTEEVKDDEGNPVYLKSIGDKVTLWYRLEQDITKLGGKTNLEVVDDKGAYDYYFRTGKFDMGKGALIIRYTDWHREKSKPEIYTNFLEANATMSADTRVKLFEEGDYEVALDYELKETPRKIGALEVIPKFRDYRVFFKFSVRNGNCMVYPFDVVTGEELTNRSITENGFYLDLAKSRYLSTLVKRSTITEGVDGLTEDPRYNSPAKDGDIFTDPGIYIITVKNKYTGEETTKHVFVGSDDLLKEYLKQGVSMDDLVVD